MKTRKQMRMKRKLGIRVHVNGSATRPRLAVYRSNTRIAAQLIDDETHTTIASSWVKGKNIEVAKKLGSEIAEKAKAKHIKLAVFDRGGFRYHGVIKAVADAAREGGLAY
jgi:large subunit ribosomal protein L18